MTALIPKTEFIGLQNLIHLAVGGESPMLRSHQKAVDAFFAHKALAEDGREHLSATYRRCKEKAGQLLGVNAGDIAFLNSASEGVNVIANALTWQAGDNVVVADVEFPSDVLPWTRLEAAGVTIRFVRQRDWRIHLEDIEAAIDDRTRVVAVSMVSYLTGQRLPLAELSAVVRRSDALFLLDATHALGAVPVAAHLADIVISSCYKWLLGVHGVSIFYWNQARLPWLEPPFLGWHTAVSIPDFADPASFIMKPGAARFEPGNPSFISVYILENALDELLLLGTKTIEAHVLQLSQAVWHGFAERGYEMMTPEKSTRRAGNVCFQADHVHELVAGLQEQGILVWGSYAGVERVRVSTHVYNSLSDVERLFETLPKA